MCVLAWLLWLMPVLPSNRSDIVRWIVFITSGHTCSLPTQNTRLHPELKVEPSAACSGWGWGTVGSEATSWLTGSPTSCLDNRGPVGLHRGASHTQSPNISRLCQHFPPALRYKHDIKLLFCISLSQGKNLFYENAASLLKGEVC